MELGLTVAEVARACGVSAPTVSKWESGTISNIKLDKVAALAEKLYLNPIDLTLSANQDRKFAFVKDIVQESITPDEIDSTPEPIIPTKDERNLLSAYRNAPENIQKSIAMLLAPYAPEKK